MPNNNIICAYPLYETFVRVRAWKALCRFASSGLLRGLSSLFTLSFFYYRGLGRTGRREWARRQFGRVFSYYSNTAGESVLLLVYTRGRWRRAKAGRICWSDRDTRYPGTFDGFMVCGPLMTIVAGKYKLLDVHIRAQMGLVVHVCIFVPLVINTTSINTALLGFIERGVRLFCLFQVFVENLRVPCCVAWVRQAAGVTVFYRRVVQKIRWGKKKKRSLRTCLSAFSDMDCPRHCTIR